MTGSDRGVLKYRLIVDGKEVWSDMLLTPPNAVGSGRGKDAQWA
jgi:hypothetical protein